MVLANYSVAAACYYPTDKVSSIFSSIISILLFFQFLLFVQIFLVIVFEEMFVELLIFRKD
jgi:hypothetical protein